MNRKFFLFHPHLLLIFLCIIFVSGGCNDTSDSGPKEDSTMNYPGEVKADEKIRADNEGYHRTAAVEKADVVEDIRISGIIDNIDQIKKYIADDTHLQLIPLYESKNPTFLTDEKGRRVYKSDLPEIVIPIDGVFCFDDIRLDPGHYAIAVQRLGLEGFSGKNIKPILSTIDGTDVQIEVPVTYPSSMLLIQLGKTYIPVPVEVMNTFEVKTPSPPPDVSATDGTFSDKISITWTKTADADSYEIYRAESFMAEKTNIGSTTAFTYVDNIVPQCNTDYYYWVTAVNASGSCDFFYNDLGYRRCPPPSAPANISASSGTFSDKVRITWTTSEGAESYDVFRSESADIVKTQIGSSTETVFEDWSIPCNRIYYYWVKAVNEDGASSFSDSDQGFIACSPDVKPVNDSDNNELIGLISVPTNVFATDGLFVDKIRITWKTSLGASEYDIYRAESPCGSKIKIATTSASSYNDFITPYTGRFFYYWIKARSSKGTSEYSDYDIGHLLWKPDVPQNISVSKGTYPCKILIRWNTAPRATAYEIYRSQAPAPVSAMLKIATTSSTSYFDEEVACAECGNILVPRFYYRVKALNDAGISNASDYDSGYVYSYQNLPAPRNIRASDGTVSCCVVVRWDAVHGAVSYDIYRSTALDGEKIKIGSIEGRDCPHYRYTDTTVTCPNIYYYWIKSVDKKLIASCEYSFPDSGYCSSCPAGGNVIYPGAGTCYDCD